MSLSTAAADPQCASADVSCTFLCTALATGGREGYSTLLNTNVKRELDHMAAFFKMAVAHKHKIGWKGQFLIEPKPKVSVERMLAASLLVPSLAGSSTSLSRLQEPAKHQYDFD